jgi:uncharacterized protein YcfJ
MIKGLVVFSFAAATALAGCTSNPPNHPDIDCAAGELGGAAVGGLVGNQIGGGSGKAIATAVGAGAGAAVGTQRAAC